MKKKATALFCTALMLCTFFCLSAFAVKPSVELITMRVTWGNTYVHSPTLYYRNNSNKAIKYVDWYTTAYNRVGDKIPGAATNKLTSVGPDQPFEVRREPYYDLNVKYGVPDDCPFKLYRETDYFVSIGNDDLRKVYQDSYGNFFVQPDLDNIYSCTYLTENEIQNAMSDRWCGFDYSGWYGTVIYSIKVDKAVITYMDGSTEVVNNPESVYRGMQLQNPPFAQQLAQYQAVYNYQDYLNCNPDLAAQYGANQKALFEHFVTSGMKEGRQGSAGFNLNAYKANNPDLVAVFGDDNVKYYKHYISQGRAEDRVAV